jgi:hypothetical protein
MLGHFRPVCVNRIGMLHMTKSSHPRPLRDSAAATPGGNAVLGSPSPGIQPACAALAEARLDPVMP